MKVRCLPLGMQAHVRVCGGMGVYLIEASIHLLSPPACHAATVETQLSTNGTQSKLSTFDKLSLSNVPVSDAFVALCLCL